MSLDYFVVGPDLALRSRAIKGRGGPHRLDFSALQAPRRERGWIHTELVHSQIHVAVYANPDVETEGAWVGEAIRLVSAVLRKLAPFEIRIACPELTAADADQLSRGGFRRDREARWCLPSAVPATQAPKVRSMQELYLDPFRVVWNFEPRPWQLLAPFLSEMSTLPGARLLDIGCGFGKNSVLLEGMGFETYGIDIATEAIEHCRRWVRHPERFQAVPTEAMPFDDATFDAILDVGCIHCLPAESVSKSITEIARVLRPGGRLFSRVFKPRPPEWLEAQPQLVRALGVPPAVLLELLEPWFEVGLHIDSEMSQVHAIRRSRGTQGQEPPRNPYSMRVWPGM